jgi:hypothetical protein
MYSSGVPDEYYGLPLMQRIKLIVAVDRNLAEARREAAFTARQEAAGYRPPNPPKTSSRPQPEKTAGALVDKAA